MSRRPRPRAGRRRVSARGAAQRYPSSTPPPVAKAGKPSIRPPKRSPRQGRGSRGLPKRSRTSLRRMGPVAKAVRPSAAELRGDEVLTHFATADAAVSSEGREAFGRGASFSRNEVLTDFATGIREIRDEPTVDPPEERPVV